MNNNKINNSKENINTCDYVSPCTKYNLYTTTSHIIQPAPLTPLHPDLCDPCPPPHPCTTR